MREPEADENHVITAVRRPGEEIGLDKTHSIVSDPGRRDGEHFRGRIHGGDLRGMTEKLAGPCSGTAGEFEHASGRPERLKRFGHLVAAGKIQALAKVARGQGAVVGDLLIEEPLEFLTTS